MFVNTAFLFGQMFYNNTKKVEQIWVTYLFIKNLIKNGVFKN
jgi:hypothetical protein